MIKINNKRWAAACGILWIVTISYADFNRAAIPVREYPTAVIEVAEKQPMNFGDGASTVSDLLSAVVAHIDE